MVHGAYILSYDFSIPSTQLTGRHSMDEAVWTEYMDRPITPPNLGVGDRGQGTNRLVWSIMQMHNVYQPEKKCIDAMLARSPNLHFGFSLPFFLRFFFGCRVQTAGDLCESGQ